MGCPADCPPEVYQNEWGQHSGGPWMTQEELEEFFKRVEGVTFEAFTFDEVQKAITNGFPHKVVDLEI